MEDPDNPACDPIANSLQQCYRRTVYDPAGQVASLTDAKGNLTAYAYDGFGRLETTTFPDSSTEVLSYDKAVNILSKVTRAGQKIAYAYDDLNRQTSKTGAQVDDVTTTYDLAGRVLTVSAAGGRSFSHVYDALGRLVSVTDQASRSVAYQYDPNGNRTRLTHPDGYFVEYSFDALNRMETAVENGSFTLATFAWDPLSRATSLTYGNGASVSFDYEADSGLKEIVHAFASGGWTLSGGGTGIEYGYSYSKVHQLTGQSANEAAMLWEPATARAVSYAVNSLNQYTDVTTDGAPAALSYDLNGNLTGDGSNSFTYDAENRLLSAAMGAGTNVSYAYGPMGRRAQKDVDGVTTEYLYDGDHAIVELDGSGAVLRRYVHGGGTDRPIAMVEGDAGSGYTHSYYHADHLGSIVALTDDTGAPVTHYTYDAYGVPYLVDPGTGAQIQVAAGQPYLYTGRRFDFETGLYYYRARYYSASLGRFLQTDPIGYEDQMNLYAYVGNDPVNAADPSGMASCSQGNCPDIPPLSDEDTKKLADAARASQKPSKEGGSVLLEDEVTGEERMKSGDEAGKGTEREFKFRFGQRKTEKIKGLGHTHLAGKKGRGKMNELSGTKKNNAPSTDDQEAMDQTGAPVVTVGPEVTTMMYRQNGQDLLKVVEGDARNLPAHLSSQGIKVCGLDTEC